MTTPAPSPRFPPMLGVSALLSLVACLLLLWATGARLGIAGIAMPLGTETSDKAGIGHILAGMWPPQIALRTPVDRIQGFNAAQLPTFASIEIEHRLIQSIDPETLSIRGHDEASEVLIEPFGYLTLVALKMVETFEIALWGTLLAVLMGFPLAILAARNMMPWQLVRAVASAFITFMRSVPELISTLFLVLIYGFGPIAGVLALAIYAAGFLGKFLAEDMENADPRPQQALLALGASPLRVLRHAIMPQIMPEASASVLYLLERNLRMATVIGLVGAGGIGQELKGRYDMYDYSHLATILLAIFFTVALLERVSNVARRRLL